MGFQNWLSYIFSYCAQLEIIQYVGVNTNIHLELVAYASFKELLNVDEHRDWIEYTLDGMNCKMKEKVTPDSHLRRPITHY